MLKLGNLMGNGETTRTLELMNKNQNFVFILTGSRFFNEKLRETAINTDWDFFVQGNEEVVIYLQGLGFNEIGASDPAYRDIPRNCGVLSVWRKGKVDVQLVSDA